MGWWEKFINDIYEEVDPLDSWLANDGDLFNPDNIWVDTVDENVIAVEWFIDGQSFGILGETLDFSGLGLGPGQFEVTALAYDSILDHSFSGDSLDWWRLDEAALQQSVNWMVFSAVPEPGSTVVLALATIPLIARRRRR